MTDPVADALVRFHEQWREYLRQGGEPPRPADFVPPASRVRRAVLIALIRADLRERAARPGLAKDIDDYRRDFPELSGPSALLDLLHEHPPHPASPAPHEDPTAHAVPGEATGLYATTRTSPGRSLASGEATGWTTPPDTRERAVSGTADPVDTAVADAGPKSSSPAAPGTTEAASELRAEDIAHVRPGDRIDDFELRTELGAGASGRVFLARQISMQRLVALRLTDRAGGAPRTMARFDHPHIVRVFDQRLPVADTAALVWMQYLPGGTAEELLALRRRCREPASGELLLAAVDAAMESKGEIPPANSPVRRALAELSWPETVAWIGRGLATALDYAARHGTAHRAIKPANIVFTAEGVPKLADFALPAPHRSSADAPQPKPALADVAVRTPSVAPGPTGVRDEIRPPTSARHSTPAHDTPPGAEDDIHALGGLLWELLTGESPCRADGSDSDRAQTSRTVAADASRRVPADCPPALRRVLSTCLEPDPRRRWANAGVLARQLDLCLDQRARDLVDPPRDSWRRRLRAWRVPLVAAAVAVPNLLASLYNIDHNQSLVTGRLSQRTQELFAVSTLITNVLFFGLATILLTYWSRRVVTVPHGLSRGVEYSPRELARARKAAILLGDRSVLVAFAFWMISAASYPVGVSLAGEELAPHAFAHFLASHAVCGAIALAYPFFLVGFYIVRCVYPMLLGYDAPGEADVALLRGLQRRCVGYLLVAASIPLLAVAGVTLLPVADIGQIIVVVRMLCIGSIVMFVASYLLFRAIERDLAALERVMTPTLDTGALTVRV
ncbi:protein kinase domain-containing protein [Nocardia shimofusensis]|uniref:protein kinase domain-containing protein n=1 Tax=Nocardia shimofusensis TaxID=228596 RepID=UPI000830E1BB|nr:protein kinase [Nocardia shimofusensis]